MQLLHRHAVRRLLILTLGLAPAAFLSSCFSDISGFGLDKVEPITWNPTVSLPVANSSFTLGEFLEEIDTLGAGLGVNDDGIVAFTYSTSFETEQAKNLYSIPTQDFSRVVDLGLGFPIAFPFDTTITFTERFVADFQTETGETLDSIYVRDGGMLASIASNFPFSGELQLEVPSLRDAQGNILVLSNTWEYDGVDPNLNFSFDVDLEDYVFDLTNGGTAQNTIFFDATLTLSIEAFEVINPDTRADINFAFNGISFYGIFGNVGTRTITQPPITLDLGLGDIIDRGVFYFSDPQLEMTFTNSYGISAGADLSQVWAISDAGDTVQLSGSLVDDLVIINGPTLAEVGQSVETQINVNAGNTNLPDILALVPDQLVFGISATVNPDGGVTDAYMLDSSLMRVDVNATIPLSGRIDNLVAVAEQDFSFGENIDLTVDRVAFNFYTRNELPFDLAVQVFFRDANMDILDSLLTDSRALLVSSTVDDNGDLVSSTESSQTIEVTQERLDRLNQATSVLIEVRLSSANNGSQVVNLRPEYTVEVDLGIEAEIETELDLSGQ